MDSERQYSHSVHAGNAGDVWKHFILGEVADHILLRKPKLMYAESHVGYPQYCLDKPGEWEGGIGRCWAKISDLRIFCYFDILYAMNKHGLEYYLGSASLLFKAAKRRGSLLQAELWDLDPQVASAWRRAERVSFHLGDGFKGARTLLGRLPPGLLLIDPPCMDQETAKSSEWLLSASKKAGWTVLLWQMMGQEFVAKSSIFEAYSLEFEEAGLDSGKWPGAIVYLVSTDQELKKFIGKRIQEFLKIIK
jgi:23S rRNA (adenine2030-N6)-methyltransferase